MRAAVEAASMAALAASSGPLHPDDQDKAELIMVRWCLKWFVNQIGLEPCTVSPKISVCVQLYAGNTLDEHLYAALTMLAGNSDLEQQYAQRAVAVRCKEVSVQAAHLGSFFIQFLSQCSGMLRSMLCCSFSLILTGGILLRTCAY